MGKLGSRLLEASGMWAGRGRDAGGAMATWGLEFIVRFGRLRWDELDDWGGGGLAG